MVSQGSDVDSVGIPGFMRADSSSPSIERGFSSPELDSGVGVYANSSEVVNGGVPLDSTLPLRAELTPSVDCINTGETGGKLNNLTKGLNLSKPVQVEFEAKDSTTPSDVNQDMKAAFAINNNERLALIAAQKHLLSMQRFIESKGFSMGDLNHHSVNSQDEFSHGSVNISRLIQGRDEYGLPIFANTGSQADKGVRSAPNPFTEKLKEEIVVAPKVVEKSPEEASINPQAEIAAKSVVAEAKYEPEKKSWASMFQKEVPQPRFSFIPSAKGAAVVQPPDEVLKKGNAKYKLCVVGTFTKGTSSYRVISEFAFKLWGPRGLQSVLKKDPNTFIFKFDCENGMTSALIKGTWYVNKRPMVVTAWGLKPGSNPITSMPLWVKLSNVPDCYWTEEGLSNLASVIGQPRCADQLTSKLDLMPFAMMQVQYEMGDPLPNEILATVLHPVTEVKSVVTVNVSYPDRPLVCLGCKSLGHLVAACPVTERVWRPKITTADAEISNLNPAVQTDPSAENNTVSLAPPCKPLEEEEGWSTVKRKHSSTSISGDEESPTPPKLFQNLKNIDKLKRRKKKEALAVHYDKEGSSSKRLTKSQKKKLKQSLGASPSRST